MNESGVSVSCRAFNEHCKFPSPFYFCNKTTVSREGSHYPPEPGMNKVRVRGAANPQGTRRTSKKETRVVESPWGASCYYSHLAKAGEYLRLLFSSVDQLTDWILRCWLPLVFLTPVEGGEVGQTPPPCEPGRTSMLSTSAMEGTLSITSSGNCGLSLDITSSG